MKYSILVMVLFSNSLASSTIDKDRDKRLNAAQLHFEAGCDFEALRICSALSGAARNDCFSDAETACPTMAKRFKAFLSNGKDK